MTLGERIKRRRKEIGMDQKHLAKKLGVTESAVSKVENGHEENMTIDRLQKYADALCCQPIELMGLSERNRNIDKKMTDDIVRLTAYYEKMSDADKQILMSIAKQMSEKE